MMSTTECNQNLLKHRQDLPRGYFKKRKPDPSPFHIAKASFSCNVKWSTMLYAAFWITIMTAESAASTATTFEPELAVLSLEKPAISNTTTHSKGINNTNGICGSIDIRYSVKKMEMLYGCRVVEGFVRILLIDEVKEEDIAIYSFPDLIEITEYLLLYRISGIKSLYQLFPNLALIRGQETYNDYALVIYEFTDLEEIGLVNLQAIARGSVRIEKNDKLCFAEMIEWSYIASHSDHYIAKNKLNRLCAHCNKELVCPKSRNDQRPLCWNQQHCQLKCNCNDLACSSSGKCCDKHCIGGCDDNDPKQCKACKQFSIYENGTITCSDSCPSGKYQYLGRRCVTKKECIDLNQKVNIDKDRGDDYTKMFIPYDKICQVNCPQYFVAYETATGISCKSCKGNECLKKCPSKVIDSIATAKSMQGCAIIDGPLEIQIRRTSKNVESNNNIVKELEAALADVVEITDYLKVARTFPLVSLNFLKKLQVIHGLRLESNKHAIVIWDNQNLEQLWDANQKVDIPVGKFFFHYNPKLCFSIIERIAKNQSLIENYEASKLSNGDKTQCNVQTLDVITNSLHSQAVLLTWKSLELEDDRSLLSYVVYYTPAEFKNVTIWEGRDACGNDGWLLEDINDFVPNDTIAFPLVNLEPFTQYAFYVKAYTLSSEKTGAQSPIQYIRTQAGQPQSVMNVDGVVKNSSTIHVTWEKPRKMNGKLSHYIIKVRMVDTGDENQRDYCLQPLEPFETAAAPYKTENPKKATIFGPSSQFPDNGQNINYCDCKTCSASCKKPQVEADDQRQSAIDFENQIQDLVYVRNIETEGLKETRAKRQVKLTDNTTTEEIVKEENIINAQGEYEQFIKEMINPSELSIVLTKLRHYTSYVISVRVCRELTEDDLVTSNQIEKVDPCSIPTQVTILTAKKDDADDIKVFEAINVPSNETYGIIKVSWKAPENPNGLLLSYTIRYRKNDIENAKWESVCIPQKNYLNQSFHLLRPLYNGNYSIQVQATSWAGTGNYTATNNVIISENIGLPIWAYALIFSIFLVVASLGLFYYVRCHYMKSLQSMKLIANVNPDYAGVQYKLDNWEVIREKVKQMHELGQGSFGMVYEGIIKDLKIEGGETRCAIKTVNENATDKERYSFLNEASVMKQFDTAFVVRLLGVVSQSEPTMVIMELMVNGDLKGYLRSHRPEHDNGSGTPPTPPTLRQILQMAAEIADGMSYLSAKKFVHRDLAARNCMVSEDLTVKIGDFGMTRDIYETDYYRKGTKGLLPVRWMSPESLKDGVFTSSSDVFSYGVVLWEISTLASQPYQGLSNDQVLRYVIEGGVMERPENCPDKLYELMRRCWQHRPSARPTFMDIIEQLLDDVNQNFRNVAFYFSKEAQDALNQLRLGDYAVNIQDDVTTPLRQGEEETSSIEGNHFLMDEMNNSSKFHEL